jgi:hypothetical protein
MKESEFWSGTVKKKLEEAKVLKYRLENSVQAGMPDVNACYKGVERWLELKVMHGLRIEVRYSQLKWLMVRTRADIFNTYYVVKDGDFIKIWQGHDILLRSKRDDIPKREDKDSMTFDPGPPAAAVRVTEHGDRLRYVLFEQDW